MDMVNWYNKIIQNVINASNDGTNLRIGIMALLIVLIQILYMGQQIYLEVFS